MANIFMKAIQASGIQRMLGQALPRAKPFSQMGRPGTPVYGGIVLMPEKNSKVIGQEKYRTYADLLANVSIVAAGVRYFLNIVARPSWSAEPADESDEAKKYADFVNDVLFEDLHTPWSRVVRRAGTYRFYGFNVQEWIANRRDDGFIGFEDIEARPQWTIWRWEVDDNGQILGMWQRDPITGRQMGLPRGKVMYLVDDTLSDSPEGLGLLRHIVEPATRLEEYLKQEAFGFMRDLRGIPIGRAPIEELSQQVALGQLTQAQMDTAVNNLMEFVKLEKKAKNTALLMSSQPYVNRSDTGESAASQYKWDMSLVSGEAPGLPEVGKAVERLQMEIARVFGVEQMMLGASSVGSHALAKEKATSLYTMANSVLRDIRLQAQHDLLWPLWSLNGWDEKLMPELKAEDVSPKDVQQVSGVLRDMATAGFMAQPDDEIQNFVRDLMGAPHVDLKKLAQMAQMQQQIMYQEKGLDADGQLPDDTSESGVGDAGGGEGPQDTAPSPTKKVRKRVRPLNWTAEERVTIRLNDE